MKLLLDTHIAFWLSVNRNGLSRAELDVLRDPANELCASSVSVWEMRLKWEKRLVSRLPGDEASPRDMIDGLNSLGVPMVALTAEQAAAKLESPPPHKDPFDHLLLTQAQEMGMQLFTRDSDMRGNPVAFFA